MSYRNRTLSEKKRIYKKLGLVIVNLTIRSDNNPEIGRAHV